MTDRSPQTTSLTAPARPPRFAERLRGWALDTPILQVGVLVALVAYLVVQVPAVANLRSITSLAIIACLLALAAMGQTLVVILGGLDLAAPGYILFGAFAATIVAGREGVPSPLAVLLVLAVCGGVGALVGWLCHRLHVEPLVVTLGIGAVLTGAALFLANGDYSSAPPPDLRNLATLSGTTFGLPIPPIILIVVLGVALLWVFLNRTVSGRRLVATGVNIRAAGLAGIRTGAVWTGVFAASGALAGISGMLIAAFSAGWSQSIGEPYLFAGLAAVLVGGTTFGSVRGSYTRTVLGALIFTVLSTIVIVNGLTEAQSRIVYGVVILVAVSLYSRVRHVRDRF
jgi:ribose transport system permease protein